MPDNLAKPQTLETSGEDFLDTENIQLCPLCGPPGNALYEGLTDRLFGVPGQWRIQQCRSDPCGLLWLDPRPTPRDIGKAYANHLTHDSSSGIRRRAGLLARLTELRGRFLRKLWQATSGLKRLRRSAGLMCLDNLTPAHLLEIGCDNGRRLAQFRDRGWQVEWQEIDAKATQFARESLGLSIHEGLMTDVMLAGESYDAIVLSHAIEHVHDPVGLLAEAHRLLKPGGTRAAL